MNLEWKYFQIVENDADNEYLYVILLNISDLLAFFELIFHKKKPKKTGEVEYENKVNKFSLKKYLIFFLVFLFWNFLQEYYFIFFINHSI